MKKILFMLIVVILSIMLLFTSCSIGGEQLKNFFGGDNQEGKFFYTGSQIGRNIDDDRPAANKRLELLAQALNNKDKNAIKAMFSKKALGEAEDFDSRIDRLFDFVQGNVQKWDKCYPATNEQLEHGHVIKKLSWWTYVYTNQEKYVFILIEFTEDTDHPNNVGLYTLRVIKAKDKGTSQFNYDELPGIFCPEK